MRFATVVESNAAELPFGARVRTGEIDTLVLLPSPTATILSRSDEIVLQGPHTNVALLYRVSWVISVRPEFLKLLCGRVRGFVGRATDQTSLPVLKLFQGLHSEAQLIELLVDGRDSVQEIWDETLFTRWWRDGMEPNSTDRRLQRICRRYGGQSPRAIKSQQQLGVALADFVENGNRYLESYADQSHFIRTCRKLTGLTPGRIKKMSGTFYIPDG